MAKKAYEENNIRAIAEKIREKTGGETTYKTSEMPTGVDEVYTKGYGEGVASVPTPTGTKDITENGEHDVAEFEKVNVNVESGGATGDNQLTQLLEGTLVNLVDNNATSIYVNEDSCMSSFAYNSTIETVYCENVKSIGIYAFYGCPMLREVYFPSVEYIGTEAFSTCKALVFADISNAKTIASGVFYDCTALTTVIIRSSAVCTLEDTLVFQLFTGLGGASYLKGITIYVPQALIESYQTATNWSTLYTAGAVTFVAIEGSEYE